MHNIHRVHTGVLDRQPPMKVGSGYAPRGPHLSNLGRRLDGITRVHANFRQVCIQRVNSVAMIDHYGISRIIEFLGQNHFARLRCENRRATGRRKIYSGMRRACLPV